MPAKSKWPRHILSRPAFNRERILHGLDYNTPAALDWVSTNYPGRRARWKRTPYADKVAQELVDSGEATGSVAGLAYILKGLIEKIESRYPVATGAAVSELRTRGLDADDDILAYLIKSEKIPAPRRDGRNRKWEAADIDRAALALAEMRRLTPGAAARDFYGIDADQDEAERPHFRAELHVMEILPGAPGLDVPALVRYRPMTDEEEADWQRRVEEAKKGD